MNLSVLGRAAPPMPAAIGGLVFGRPVPVVKEVNYIKVAPPLAM